MINANNKKLLIMSLAINGYKWLYKDNIKSHQRYAQRLHSEYVVVTKPGISSLGTECCWLKLHLMLSALQLGYQQVMFVDADTYIQESAPDIRRELTPGKSIYMAKSYTGRFNSGVMLVTGSPAGLQFLQNVIASHHTRLQQEYDVGWGENGHVIREAENNPQVRELSIKWNNTSQQHCRDYIRHFNHGPLRKSWGLKISHKCLSLTSHLWWKVKLLCCYQSKKALLSETIHKEMLIIRRYYQRFFAV